MTTVATATIMAGIKRSFFFLNFAGGGGSGDGFGGGDNFLTFIVGNGEGTLSSGSSSYISIGWTFLGGLETILF